MLKNIPDIAKLSTKKNSYTFLNIMNIYITDIPIMGTGTDPTCCGSKPKPSSRTTALRAPLPSAAYLSWSAGRWHNCLPPIWMGIGYTLQQTPNIKTSTSPSFSVSINECLLRMDVYNIHTFKTETTEQINEFVIKILICISSV